MVNPRGDGSGPGLVLLIPIIDKMVRVGLRTITTDVLPQHVITWDNVSVKVGSAYQPWVQLSGLSMTTARSSQRSDGYCKPRVSP